MDGRLRRGRSTYVRAGRQQGERLSPRSREAAKQKLHRHARYSRGRHSDSGEPVRAGSGSDQGALGYERRRGHRVAPAIAEGGARSGGGTGAARAPPRLRLSRAPNGDSRTSRSFVRKTGLLCYVNRCRRINLTTSDPMEAVTLKGTPPVTREYAEVLNRFQWKTRSSSTAVKNLNIQRQRQRLDMRSVYKVTRCRYIATVLSVP